jgi:hypothetical protein
MRRQQLGLDNQSMPRPSRDEDPESWSRCGQRASAHTNALIAINNWRAFTFAMRDKDRPNKNEIEIFIFSVTPNDFPHDMLLLIFSLKIGAAILQTRAWSIALLR